MPRAVQQRRFPTHNSSRTVAWLAHPNTETLTYTHARALKLKGSLTYRTTINKLARNSRAQITTILINGFLVDCAMDFIFYYVSIGPRSLATALTQRESASRSPRSHPSALPAIPTNHPYPPDPGTTENKRLGDARFGPGSGHRQPYRNPVR